MGDLAEERAAAYVEANARGSSENLVWNASTSTSPEVTLAFSLSRCPCVAGNALPYMSRCPALTVKAAAEIRGDMRRPARHAALLPDKEDGLYRERDAKASF